MKISLSNIHLATSLILAQLLFFSCATTQSKNVASQSLQKNNYVALGNQYAQDGLYREAADAYKKAIGLNKDNCTAYRNLGMVLVKAGDYKNAGKNLKYCLKEFDKDFDVNFYLGEALRAQNDFSNAIFFYQKAKNINPKHTETLKALAWSYYKIRYFQGALNTIDMINAPESSEVQITLIHARTLIKLGRIGSALKILNKAKASAHSANRAFLLSVEGDALYQLKKIDDAITVYREALKDQPLLAGALLGLGKALITKGELDKGHKLLLRAARIKPDLAETLYYLGRLYEKKSPAKAYKFYRQFYKRAQNDP